MLVLIWVLAPFALVGFLFTTLLITGLIRNTLQCGIALDQWAGTCVIKDAMADETVSAWTCRNKHRRTEKLINWAFRNPNHCYEAYLSEMRGTQNAVDYRKE